MKKPARLEDLPNIDPAIAADLRRPGINTPAQLAKRDPLKTCLALGPTMAQRHDPCLLYTLLAAKYFLDGGEARKWRTFAEAGKALLKQLQNDPKVI